MKNVRHSGIVIHNIEKALYFYCKLLGLKEVIRETLSGNYIKTLLSFKTLTYLKLATDNGDLIELYYFPSNNGCIKFGTYNHIAFTVKDLDKTYKKLKKEKIHFCSEPILDPTKTHKVVFCEDPSGNLIELVEECIKS